MRIALVYNEPTPSRYDALGEGLAVASVTDSLQAIADVLAAKGHTVALLGLMPPLPKAMATLGRLDVDLFFNLFEGFDGSSETEWRFARELGHLGHPFTGANAETLAICLNKARTKQLLASHGIPTPPFQLLNPKTLDRLSLDFPVIVKPLQEDASHGIGPRSVVHNFQAMAERVGYIVEKYAGPALIESFLPGREFNTSVLGGQPPRTLAPTEVVYSPETPTPRIMSYAAKWFPRNPAYQRVTLVCPAQVSEAMRHEIEELTLAAHRAVGSPPYVRVDLRADAQGHLQVLEVNPNPDLSPTAGMAFQAGAAGLTYGDLIETIINLALEERSVGGYRAASYAT